jgi:NAD(P)H-hydrate epimerase
MAEIDRIAIEETGPNLYQMMENAGRNLAGTAMEMLGESWRGMQTVVLAGTGGNGGGGICCARHLVNRGVDVRLALTSTGKLRGVPADQRKTYLSAGGKEVDHVQLTSLRPDLIIDAIIGYSLDSAPHGAALDLVLWAAECGAPILSLDIPSGTDSTTGATPGKSLVPDRTLTLALPKTGLAIAPTGDLYLGDLGIPAAAYARAGVDYVSPFDERYVIPISVAG